MTRGKYLKIQYQFKLWVLYSIPAAHSLRHKHNEIVHFQLTEILGNFSIFYALAKMIKQLLSVSLL